MTETWGSEKRRRLYVRTHGTCEWCGGFMWDADMDAHHRLLRSRGGTWAFSNIIGVHHDCHVNQPGSIHMQPRKATRRGAMLSSGTDPLEVPIEFGGRLWMLTDDGRRYEQTITF